MTYGSNYYSIILKGCSRREKLTQRLENILLRGRLAIRMALENMPSVIIYKGKVDNIVPVLQAFKAEYATVTVIADGVPAALPITKKYRDFASLDSDLQQLLIGTPDNLWLGEAIYRIVPASFLDEAGALVITSHALYFIDKPAGDDICRWLIIPYSQLTDTPDLKISDGTELTINHLDTAGYQQDSFILPAELLHPVKAAIYQAKSASKYLTRLRSTCENCGQVSEEYAENILTQQNCTNCGGLRNWTILS